jgi:hypothetical protein
LAQYSTEAEFQTPNYDIMKKLFLLSVMFILLAIPSNAQKVNDAVEIQHNGTWYPGKILKTDGDKYFITYEGWSDSWDEWVTIDRLRGFKTAEVKEEAPKAPLTKFKVGDRVEVEYGMVPEPATVIEVGENKYHIKYDKAAFKSKWVTEREIKKL